MNVVSKIEPSKDIDGLNSNNTLYVRGATAEAAIRVVKSAKSLRRVGIVGSLRFVGASIKQGLLESKDFIIQEVNEGEDLEELRANEVIISAAGQPGIIRKTSLSKNTILGIDVGNTRSGETVIGDFDRNSVLGSLEYLTPVPGGMGPLEMVILAERLVRNTYIPDFKINFSLMS